MTSFLFGLLCLCILNVERIKGAEKNEIIDGLFSWFANQIRDPETIELREFKQACRNSDTDKNGYLSLEETRAILTALHLPPSRYFEYIFGDYNVKNAGSFNTYYFLMDKKESGFVYLSGFWAFYNLGVLELDADSNRVENISDTQLLECLKYLKQQYDKKNLISK